MSVEFRPESRLNQRADFSPLLRYFSPAVGKNTFLPAAASRIKNSADFGGRIIFPDNQAHSQLFTKYFILMVFAYHVRQPAIEKSKMAHTQALKQITH